MTRHDSAQDRARATFLETGAPSAHVRSLVADSWVRSAAAGVDPDSNLAPVVLDTSDLREYREAHPLSQVFPLLYDVIGQAAVDCDCVMAVGDAEGKLLWVCGAPDVLRRAEGIHFVEGSAWDEYNAGTNAPGTALHLGAPVRIRASEHFNKLVQPWSCAAAPIHDPQTHAILGLVDVTGGDDVASPQTLAMVRAAARMAESELARIALEAHRWAPPELRRRPATGHLGIAPVLHLSGLGMPDCVARVGSRSYRLSGRHGEILALLVDYPDGLTAEQLEIEVYSGDVQSSTVRAEMTRLRTLLGNGILESRPYRLAIQSDCDWKAVGALLSAGRVDDALRAYGGPLLPRSESPGVVQRRNSLHHQLRSAILSSGKADLMVVWTRSRWGADDLEMWWQQIDRLPERSPLRPIAMAEVNRLEREFGIGRRPERRPLGP